MHKNPLAAGAPTRTPVVWGSLYSAPTNTIAGGEVAVSLLSNNPIFALDPSIALAVDPLVIFLIIQTLLLLVMLSTLTPSDDLQ